MIFRLSILFAIAVNVAIGRDLMADATASLSIPTIVKAEPAADLNALFDNKNGWIGADGCYSVATGPGRVIWIYSDTILGKVKDGKRTEPTMVNNSIAIQMGEAKDATVRFVIGKGDDGKPAAMFKPADGKGWFWSHAPIMVSGKLCIFLAQMEKSHDPGVFGFKQIAEWLAVVENPGDEPAQWRVTQRKLPFGKYAGDGSQSWGSVVLAVGDTLYIYGYDEKEKGFGKRRLVVARAPADKLDDFKTWRFLTASGWGERPADAIPLADGLATEFSVTPNPVGKGYVAVYTESGLSDRIVARFADEPQGPWSPATLLYTSPEMKKDKGVFCYGARAHPWASNGNELVLSYCQNTWEFKHVFEDDSIYRPKFVRVQLAPLTSAEPPPPSPIRRRPGR